MHSTFFSLVSTVRAHFFDTIREDNRTQLDLIKLHQQLLDGVAAPHISITNGILFFKNRYYIAVDSTIKIATLTLAGHEGSTKTFAQLENSFYWPGMRKDVELFIASCLVCQQTKYSTQAPTGLLQPLLVPTQIWDTVTMDFITTLPSSLGFTTIMVIIVLSK